MLLSSFHPNLPLSRGELELLLNFSGDYVSLVQSVFDGLGGDKLGKEGIDVSGNFSRGFSSTSGNLFDGSMLIST